MSDLRLTLKPKCLPSRLHCDHMSKASKGQVISYYGNNLRRGQALTQVDLDPHHFIHLRAVHC